MVSGGGQYGSVVDTPVARPHPQAKTLRIAVLAIAMCLVVLATAATVGWTKELKKESVLMVVGGPNDVNKEEALVKAEQHKLDILNMKANIEQKRADAHAGNENKERYLAEAAQAKSRASKEIAHALLATVRQRSAELAKASALATEKKSKKIEHAQELKAAALQKRADAEHQAALAANAAADADEKEVARASRKLRRVKAHRDKLMLEMNKETSEAQTNSHRAESKKDLEKMGDTAAAALQRKSAQLKAKANRLARRMDELTSREEDLKDKAQLNREDAAKLTHLADSAKAGEQLLHKEARQTRALEHKHSDEIDKLTDQLESVKEKVHAKDDKLEHAEARKHRAAAALRRANSRLKESERRIYLAQERGEAVASDHDLTDADLGLV
mmetsp:Transcript_29246/g.67825  ORF Transcript_29246/g.67825 Transcript_29246/m.67825 type:complete len:388 (+) Transcript_29246:40-1203(+)